MVDGRSLQIAFGQELFDYNNMPNAMQSMSRAIVGDFDFTVLMGPGRAVTNNTIGMCLCVTYVVAQFVVLSMLSGYLRPCVRRRAGRAAT